MTPLKLKVSIQLIVHYNEYSLMYLLCSCKSIQKSQNAKRAGKAEITKK